MGKLFEVNLNVGGMWYMVGGYQSDNCVEEITRVMVLVGENNCPLYFDAVVNKQKFMEFFEDYINEALEEQAENDKFVQGDLKYDAWKEEQMFNSEE